MGDSSSFSSLFALVDNHLSKTDVEQECQPSTSGLGQFRLSSPFNMQRGSSDTGLRSTPMRFPVPGPGHSFSANRIPNSLPKPFGSFSDDDEPKEEQEPVAGPSMCVSDRHINDVLAIQLSNMFKAREAREEEERRKQELKKIEENMQKLQLEQSNCLIDLMPAVQRPGQVLPQNVDIPSSSSSSMESLVLPDATEEESQELSDDEEAARPESPKPITTDMRYILKHKIGKCSQFGKVLCARYRPVAAPYFRVRVPHNIKVFDFSTPSPDDIMLERLRKPSFYSSGNKSLSVFD